jgi:hypothetical protein
MAISWCTFLKDYFYSSAIGYAGGKGLKDIRNSII